MTLRARFRRLRGELREWFRPPRRLRLQAGGTVLIVGVFALGIATLNTGNNLLYLLVGALLGLIALSGWLSEQTISGIHVERHVPHAVTAGQAARFEYRVHNRKRRLPTVSLELTDVTLARGGTVLRTDAESAYLPFVAAGVTGAAGAHVTLPRRGVYRFDRLVAATSYPFGFFIKERDLRVEGSLVVWPRTDRAVRALRGGGRRGARRSAGAGAALGAERGDFRALRPYRPGDDPRDVHWRSSARRAEPVVREYDRDNADAYWIVLDIDAAADASLEEAAVELAAALAARAAEHGHRFGFAADTGRIVPSEGGGQLEAVLDLLARVEFRSGAPLALPAPAAECVLVTARAARDGAFADVIEAHAEADA